MSHSSEPNRELSNAMKKLFGEYPEGKLNDEDAGALAMEVGIEGSKVVVRFPKPVCWFGMSGDDAMGLAQLLIKHARSVGVTAPLILRVGE